MAEPVNPSPFQLPEAMIAQLRDSGPTMEAAKAAMDAMKALGMDVTELEKTYSTISASRKIMLDAFDKQAKK